MKKFVHSTHTVYAFRDWTLKKSGIVLVLNTGNRILARDMWNPCNWRLRVYPGRLNPWHWFIRLPFFYLNRNNTGFEIGHPNLYLWVIH